MNLKILSLNDEPAMVELLRSEKSATEVEFYIDRGTSFWKIYNWFSEDINIALGVYDKVLLVGLVILAKLPFKFKDSHLTNYLVSDFFVHPQYRRSFVAAKLFTGLQTNLPQPGFLEIAIENRYGFLQSIGKFSKKYGNYSEWVKESNLITIYPNQKIEEPNPSHQFTLSEDGNKIKAHLEKYRKNSNSWVDWKEEIILQGIFHKLILFNYVDKNQEVSGLLFDRGNFQKLRWNGQTRLFIEKYRRALGVKLKTLKIDDELPFLNTSFVLNTDNNSKLPKELVARLYNFGFENNYFGVNFRDVDLETPLHCDHFSFLRRYVLATRLPDTDLKKIIEKNADRKVILESVYL